MDVVVSGASGLIGSALSDELHRAGHRVRACGGAASPTATTSAGIRQAGLIDAPALEGVDAVVHLAGEGIAEKKWSDEQKQRILDSRVRGTSVLAGAIASRERKPRVFVSGSAIGYYGSRGDEVLTEDSAPGDDFLAGVVQAWEAETQARGRRRDPHRAHPFRDRARRARWRVEAAPASVQARARWPRRIRQAVDVVGHPCRRGRWRSCTRSRTTASPVR